MRQMIPDLPFRPRTRTIAVQGAAISMMIDLMFMRPPHYQRMFAERGITRTDIRDLSEIGKTPVIATPNSAAEPVVFRLETGGLEEEAVINSDVMHTTGTSGGRPTPVYSTARDFFGSLTTNRRAVELRGVTKQDVVANPHLMTLSPHGAHYRTIAVANAMNTPVIGPLTDWPSSGFHWSVRLDDVVVAVARALATVLWGVTSYICRVSLRAEVMAADPTALRSSFVTGDPANAEMRLDLSCRMVTMGATEPRVHVSFVETGMQVDAMECRHDSGDNDVPDQLLFEVVDPETHALLPNSAPGLDVLIRLDRRGAVRLRYALGDLLALTRAACPFRGTTADRLVGAPACADDIVKVRGMIIDQVVLCDVDLATPEKRVYQVAIDHEDRGDLFSMGQLTLRMSLAPGVADDVSGGLADAVLRRTGSRPVVELAPISGSFSDYRTVKARRAFDTRRRELSA